MVATGHPKELLAHCDVPNVRRFLTRGAAGRSARRGHESTLESQLDRGFVVGAVALLVVAVLVVGSGRLFKKSYTVVCYFEGGVNGLHVGAPVKIKGVEIGSVDRILLSFEHSEPSLRIPVFLEIDPERVAGYGVQGALDRKLVETAVQRGLRARLQSQSLLTGLMEVQLDFVPESEAVFVGGGGIPEIPTLPTSTSEMESSLRDILAKLRRAELPDLVNHATSTADAIREFAAGAQTRKAMVSLERALTDVSALAEDVAAEGRSDRGEPGSDDGGSEEHGR